MDEVYKADLDDHVLNSKEDNNQSQFNANPPIDDTDPVQSLLASQTKVSTAKNKDTLIDIKIGNPLKKITELLEDIKKQKAFSFTLKGSLGIMGVVLSLSMLGFLGTSHALCDKGVQTHIGKVKMLQVYDTEPDTFFTKIKSITNFISSIFTKQTQPIHRYRYILQTGDLKTIHLDRGRDVTLSEFKDKVIYATGVYDSCAANLKISEPNSIELYQL